MPTYEYECKKCGLRFEKFQKMTDEPIKACPKCKKSVRRLIGTGGGIIFKGSGFYATDYRKGKPSEDRKKEGAQKACPQGKTVKESTCSRCPTKQNEGK